VTEQQVDVAVAVDVDVDAAPAACAGDVAVAVDRLRRGARLRRGLVSRPAAWVGEQAFGLRP
jgi:hypothetical protein